MWCEAVGMSGEVLVGEDAFFLFGEGNVAFGHGLQKAASGGEIIPPILRVIVQTKLGISTIGVDVRVQPEGFALPTKQLAYCSHCHILAVLAGAAKSWCHDFNYEL